MLLYHSQHAYTYEYVEYLLLLNCLCQQNISRKAGIIVLLSYSDVGFLYSSICKAAYVVVVRASEKHQYTQCSQSMYYRTYTRKYE